MSGGGNNWWSNQSNFANFNSTYPDFDMRAIFDRHDTEKNGIDIRSSRFRDLCNACARYPTS